MDADPSDHGHVEHLRGWHGGERGRIHPSFGLIPGCDRLALRLKAEAGSPMNIDPDPETADKQGTETANGWSLGLVYQLGQWSFDKVTRPLVWLKCNGFLLEWKFCR
jgi:hypothetical protein